MDEPTRTRRERRQARRRASVVGVIGEVLITAGVVVLLFLGWQIWFSELTVGAAERGQAAEQSREWTEEAESEPTPSATPSAEATDEPAEPEQPAVIPVQSAPGNAESFAMLIVPRFGGDFYRNIAEGVGTADVLNRNKFGHYPSSQMPGEVGNFAIAAHRLAYGGGLHYINELRVGDHIFVETSDGWYQYTFRNLEYVKPTGVGVIAPVPQSPDFAPTERLITLTSCNPFYSTAERIIAYGTFDAFYPRDAAKPAGGAPDEIAATVAPGGDA